MPRRPLPPQIASDLRYHQRVMLFCLASGDDWMRAGVTHTTAQHLLTRGLIARASTPAQFKLTTLGRNVLALLCKTPVNEQDG
jgi:hypothetical protein